MSSGENTPSAQQGAADQARSAAHDAKDAAASAARDARDAAGNVASNLKDQAEASIGSQKDMAADRVDEVAKAVRSSAESLSGREEWLAGLITEGADELGSLANMLRTNDLRALIGHVEDFARRQPTLFTGLAVFAGFAAARVTKSSSGHPGASHSSSGQFSSGQFSSGQSASDRSGSAASRPSASRPRPAGSGEPPENYWKTADSRHSSGLEENSASTGTASGASTSGAGRFGAVNPGPVPFNPAPSGPAAASPGVLPQNKP